MQFAYMKPNTKILTRAPLHHQGVSLRSVARYQVVVGGDGSHITEHHAMKSYWGSGGTLHPFFDLGTRRR